MGHVQPHFAAPFSAIHVTHHVFTELGYGRFQPYQGLPGFAQAPLQTVQPFVHLVQI